MRFTWHDGLNLPQLGDIACWESGPNAHDHDVAQRAYRVVGIEEGRDRNHFRLLMERIEWSDAREVIVEDGPWWPFYDTPRGER